MHLFSKSDKTLRNVWIKFVQKHRPLLHPPAYSALRSAYFESRCFTQGLEIGNNAKTKRWLNKDAYPTVRGTFRNKYYCQGYLQKQVAKYLTENTER